MSGQRLLQRLETHPLGLGTLFAQALLLVGFVLLIIAIDKSPLAGARTADGKGLLNIREAIIRGESPTPLLAGTNTTIGVVATDAILTKAQAHRLAQVSHDGLARAINPVHTLSDGDTMFALGTGASGKTAGMMVLSTLAAEVTARAIVRAVRAATSVSWNGNHWPCAAELTSR